MNRLLWSAIILCIAGCSNTNTQNKIISPQTPTVSTYGGTSRAQFVIPADTLDEPPKVLGIAAIVNNTLYIRTRVFTLPADYTFQVFINTDRLSTGYAGYEYIARGPNIDPAGLVVRTTQDVPSNPGGWGPITGNFSNRRFSVRDFIAIPLSSLENKGADAKILVHFYYGYEIASLHLDLRNYSL